MFRKAFSSSPSLAQYNTFFGFCHLPFFSNKPLKSTPSSRITAIQIKFFTQNECGFRCKRARYRKGAMMTKSAMVVTILMFSPIKDVETSCVFQKRSDFETQPCELKTMPHQSSFPLPEVYEHRNPKRSQDPDFSPFRG